MRDRPQRRAAAETVTAISRWFGSARGRATAELTGVALVGVLSGLVGAYSYYSSLLRPLSHTFGLWILIAAVVSARQSGRRAVLRSTIALVSAVVAFYLGRAWVYDLRYSGITINAAWVYLWCLLAIIAGSVLGLVFHAIGGLGWPAAGATAAAIGLLVADAARRGLNYADQVPVLVVFLAAAVAVVVFVLADRSLRQVGRTFLLIGPCALIGYVLVSVPDTIEQLVFIGF